LILKSRLQIGLALFIVFFPGVVFTQGLIEGAKVTGNVQIDAQYYSEDKKLGVTDSTLNFRKTGMNAFANLLYTSGDFAAGMRMEAFLNPMLGFDSRYEGVGIPYWFARYKTGTLEMTAGHFYEQFGSGLALRSYEEWALGYDNSQYGFNARFSPYQGIKLKGLVGVHRYFWEPYQAGNRGIVKGVDGDFYLNEIFGRLAESKTRINIGGSFVSKYERPPQSESYILNDTIFGDTVTVVQTTYQLVYPHNVGSYALRANVSHGGLSFYAEYAEKSNDPNETNSYIFRKGSALYSSVSFSATGLGVFLSTKWIDNMSYKSKLKEPGTPPMLDINYLPAISKEHPYSLSSMYPYATLPNGEFGLQGQIDYRIPRGTKLGGAHGMLITVNYSLAKSIDKEMLEVSPITGTIKGTNGYKTSFLSVGDLLYYRDLNLLIDRRINRTWKAVAAYYNQTYNQNALEKGTFDDTQMIDMHIGVIDLSYRMTRRNTLRMEFQALFTEDDKGDWASLLVEYNASPNWFITVQDEYNYGNSSKNDRLHYFNVSAGYNQGTNRFSLRYGRQREGMICIGGVCRHVPASSGFGLTITSSF
jgi:hypothetical protein